MLARRLAASAPLIILGVTALFWPGTAGAAVFLGLAAFLIVAATYEFFAMTKKVGVEGYPLAAAAFSLLLLAGIWHTATVDPAPGRPAAVESLILAAFVLTLVLLTCRRPPNARSLTALLVSLGGFMLVTWMLTFVAKLYFAAGAASAGRHLAFFMLLVTKIADAGAYAAGSWTAARPGGNRRLAPTISPGKSWEGLAGGIVAALVTGLILVLVMGSRLSLGGVVVIGWRDALALGVICPVVGLLGDLGESVLKRASGVKDSGRIPGLGGALDILDSLITVAPVFYLYIRFRSGW